MVFQLTVDDGHVLDSDVAQISLVDLTDADGDGFPACGDCQPTNASQKPPGQTSNLRFTTKVALAWDSVSGATNYDLCRGTLGGPYFKYDHACIAKALGAPNGTDSAVPAASKGFYYLSRANNACGRGIFGIARDGSGIPNPACP